MMFVNFELHYIVRKDQFCLNELRITKKLTNGASGGSKGGPGMHTPWGPNSFILMQFSAKIIGSHTHFGSWRPPQENPGSATGSSSILFPYFRINFQKKYDTEWTLKVTLNQLTFGTFCVM